VVENSQFSPRIGRAEGWPETGRDAGRLVLGAAGGGPRERVEKWRVLGAGDCPEMAFDKRVGQFDPK